MTSAAQQLTVQSSHNRTQLMFSLQCVCKPCPGFQPQSPGWVALSILWVHTDNVLSSQVHNRLLTSLCRHPGQQSFMLFG